MKKIKKILIITIVVVMIRPILIGVSQKVGASLSITEGEPVKVGVLLIDFTDDYIALLRQDLEEIQKNNEGKVEFTFLDSKNNEVIQNDNLNTLIQNHVDAILLNIIEVKNAQQVINKIKEANIPVILFNREPLAVEPIKSYERAYYVGTDAKEAGILQAKILIDKWNTDKAAIDRNGDGIMQYIMLKGEKDNIEAKERTKYSVLTINNAGIKTEELESRFCDWNKKLAKEAILSIFLKYGNGIEAIIANNDSMAEGAIEALQVYGYNKGDERKNISVVGVDAIPSAQELIRKGIMEGSVLQDQKAMAEALYTIGMNLAYGKKPLEGTNYKFDQTGIAVRIPYQEFIINK
ncbi:galactose ABC transporter substrate-binding protein [Clostridium vincentii]|uniref:D-galactose/methyl-galactoside binding periplasmic protein MglB n=1 Tax=Clostridium vincentii TaxID=52704 RepID=A0A2T0BAY4_9CLOT|nr:galactose ABC transporter substrate-binding protein [Clostridium vincentii]PRR81002.1 D-galactose-binding periplasmic protein precursor [Clostridium vincentii]